MRSIAIPSADACTLLAAPSFGTLSLSASGTGLSFACTAQGVGEAVSPLLSSIASVSWTGVYSQASSLGAVSLGVPAGGAVALNASTGAGGASYAALGSGVAFVPVNRSAAAVLVQSMYAASQVLIYSGTLYFSSPSGRGVFQLGALGVLPVSAPASATLVTPAYASGAEAPVSFAVQSSGAMWVCDAGPSATARGVWAVSGGSLPTSDGVLVRC